MTIEEAIKILDPETRRETMREIPCFERIAADTEACKIAVAALRTQQTTTNLDRSRWGECEMCGDGEVNASPGAHDFVIADDCLFYNDSSYGLEGIRIKYCPACGRPLTEEAWAELERRINGG